MCLTEKIVFILLFLYGVVLFILGFGITESTISRGIGGPVFLPQLFAVILSLLSLVILIKEFFKSRKDGFIMEKIDLISKDNLIIIGLIILYLFFMPKIGYLVTTIIFSTVSCLYLGKSKIKNKFKTVAIVCIISIFTYFLFNKILLVFLPAGILI